MAQQSCNFLMKFAKKLEPDTIIPEGFQYIRNVQELIKRKSKAVNANDFLNLDEIQEAL